MFCPMMNRECIKDKCAWWHSYSFDSPETDGDCAVRMISHNLDNAASELEEIDMDLYKLRIGDDSK